MTRRLPILLALALALVAGITHAQTQRYVRQDATLAHAWDLDGEAADDDQVVTAANGALTDSKTFTLTADPDVCRLANITVTDADSSVNTGTLTVAGLGCLGEARSCSWTFAGDGTGVYPLTCTDGQGAYFSDVTSVTTSVMTGEGAGDVAIVGYAAINSVNGWGMYGTLSTGSNGERIVNPFGSTAVALPITTSGAKSTTVAAVATNAAFTDVAVGDLLLIPITGGEVYERKVTAKASVNSITVNQAITIPAAGVPFSYRRFYYSTNPADILAVPVAGWSRAVFNWAVQANANTGGVVCKLECTRKDAGWPTGAWVTQPLPITTIASGATTVDDAGLFSSISEVIDVEARGYTHCRMGFRFGTGDDADGAVEALHLGVVLQR
jgi:hypothetical protein